MSAVPRRLLPDSAAIADDGWLTIGGCHLGALTEQFGTPLFVYDEGQLRSRCREAVQVFGRGRVVYATKAFLCRAMARLAHEEGLLLDVSTGGELHVALSAGVPGSQCVLHGNNKSDEEIRAALSAGIGRIVVDSFDELDRLEAAHRDGFGPVPDVLIRVTPGVHAHTHEFISTGQDDSKFGFNLANGDARRAVSQAAASPAVNLVGTHCHIGSNVFRAESFARAVEVMAGFAAEVELPQLVLGGGLGVAYTAAEEAPTISQWASVLREACESLGVSSDVYVEPGRSIVADAAVTAYTVGTIKDIPDVRTYVAVDGGMSDNPRPVLYGSGYEALLARSPFAERPLTVRVVGKHCESGDVLLSDAAVPEDLRVGDVLVTPVTGAYGQSMGSNYNRIRRPAVVFASGGSAREVVRRETFDDLLATDVG